MDATSSPRLGACGIRGPGSLKFVSAAKRPVRVTPSHVPPACKSRPASICGRSCHQSAGAVGRAWNSSRFAAMTHEYRGCVRQTTSTKHMDDFPAVLDCLRRRECLVHYFYPMLHRRERAGLQVLNASDVGRDDALRIELLKVAELRSRNCRASTGCSTE